MSDQSIEEPDDQSYDSELITFEMLGIIDKTDLPKQLRTEILEQLVNLNTFDIRIQISSTCDFIKNHEDKYAVHALSPKEIWDTIHFYNQLNPISERLEDLEIDMNIARIADGLQ